MLLKVAHNLQNRSRPLNCAPKYGGKAANLLVLRNANVVVIVAVVSIVAAGEE